MSNEALTLSLWLKLAPGKLELWFVLWSFFLLRLLCISINLPYSLAWNNFVMPGMGAPSCYLEMLDKLQICICRIVDSLLAASFESLAHCWNVARLSLFCRYYFGKCLSELFQLVPFPYSWGRFTHSATFPEISWGYRLYLKSLVLVSQEAPSLRDWGWRDQNVLYLILLHRWKRHLSIPRHFKLKQTFVFYACNFFWLPEFGCWYCICGIKISQDMLLLLFW